MGLPGVFDYSVRRRERGRVKPGAKCSFQGVRALVVKAGARPLRAHLDPGGGSSGRSIMHPEQAAFLRAITDDPDDDTVRLIYADWLEEHGDDTDRARAAYIRLAIEKAGLPRRHHRRTRLQNEMNVLLQAHHRRWFPRSPLLHFAGRHRGFICHARPRHGFQRPRRCPFRGEPDHVALPRAWRRRFRGVRVQPVAEAITVPQSSRWLYTTWRDGKVRHCGATCGAAKVGGVGLEKHPR